MTKLGLAALPLIPGGGYGSSHFGGCCAAAHFGRGAVVVLILGGGGWPRYCSSWGGCGLATIIPMSGVGVDAGWLQ